MNLTIQTFTHGKLILHPVVPTGWLETLRIPGSQPWSAEGDFGTLFFEEYQSDPFTVRFCFLRFTQKMTILFDEPSSFITARIITKGNWHFSAGKQPISLGPDQYLIYRANEIQEKFVFEKNREYQCLVILCEPQKLEEFASAIPELAESLNDPLSDKSFFLGKKPGQISREVTDIIRSIIDSPYTGATGEYYIRQCLEKLFFLLLVLSDKKESKKITPTKEEIEAAHAAAQLIVADITRHYSIPEIARQVHLNEFRLKYVFKHIFKRGIFTYLLQARMNEARDLLAHSDKPIKEIASLTGYKLAGFITAFRKYFGYTPGSIRKNT